MSLSCARDPCPVSLVFDRYSWVVVQACRKLERPQDGAPASDIQAQQMGMGERETLERERRSVHLCSGTVDVVTLGGQRGVASLLLPLLFAWYRSAQVVNYSVHSGYMAVFPDHIEV